MDRASYPHKECGLTPSSVSYLIRNGLEGQTLERSVIVKYVSAKHVELGGILKEGVNVTLQVKKALATMAESKTAMRMPTYGYWHINSTTPANAESTRDEQTETESTRDEPTEAGSMRDEAPEDDENAGMDNESLDCYSKDEQYIHELYHSLNVSIGLEPRIIGKGAESVYVYWFPAAQMISSNLGMNRWPCKVGSSKVDAFARIHDQCGTSSWETPIIGLVVRTKDSVFMEKWLHHCLKQEARKCKYSRGNEWYYTNPAEIEEMCRDGRFVK